MGLLCNCTLDDYKYEDDTYTMSYSDGTVIRLNDENIEIKNGDRYLTKGGNTLVDGYKSGEYIGYTKSGAFRMKKYFDGEITKISEIGKETDAIGYDICDGDICIDTKADTAFRIYIG